MSGSAGAYQLGIDLGTTYTAAAVARQGRVEMVGLGSQSAAIPSIIHVGADGAVLTGDAANRRVPSEPDRVAREFKRRIGDPTPLLLGGTPYSAEALTGTLLRWVIDTVSELEGGPPGHVAVTHPANWGPYKQDVFAQCLRMAGASAATTLTEPAAAAIAYAANERVEQGALVAVYDLGGGTFDAAILRKTADGFAILGRPEGIERLGGVDFDQAVIGHVRAALGGALERVDLEDPAAMTALTRLRRECVEAKEALSSDTETTIPVLLPGVQAEVRLTRAELEQMVRPTLSATVDAMRRALTSAAVDPSQVSAVLLVGGSSRIPLVAELVSDAFGRPIAVDAHPKHAIALGAAHAAALEVEGQATGEHDAVVLPLAAAGTAAATGLDDTVDLRAGLPAAGMATEAQMAGAHAATADRPAAGGGAADGGAAADRADEVVEDLPAWLVEAREPHGRRSRSRLWLGVVAAVVLSVLTIGAGAVFSDDVRSDAGPHATAAPREDTSGPGAGAQDEPSADAGAGQDAGAQDDDVDATTTTGQQRSTGEGDGGQDVDGRGQGGTAGSARDGQAPGPDGNTPVEPAGEDPAVPPGDGGDPAPVDPPPDQGGDPDPVDPPPPEPEPDPDASEPPTGGGTTGSDTGSGGVAQGPGGDEVDPTATPSPPSSPS